MLSGYKGWTRSGGLEGYKYEFGYSSMNASTSGYKSKRDELFEILSSKLEDISPFVGTLNHEMESSEESSNTEKLYFSPEGNWVAILSYPKIKSFGVAGLVRLTIKTNEEAVPISIRDMINEYNSGADEDLKMLENLSQSTGNVAPELYSLPR